jgi:hypothetical protein
VTNPFKRGSAPGRGQPDYLRPGNFKSGHEKHGGRKCGTPNVFSADYKKAIIEAAYRVGWDGNGYLGIVGYLAWVAAYHPPAFFVLLNSILVLENVETEAPERPCRTLDEIDQWCVEYIGLTSKTRTKRRTADAESGSAWDWTGQDFPVGSLMHAAVTGPKAFCKLIVAGFLRPPTRLQRGLAARRAWEQRQRVGDR